MNQANEAVRQLRKTLAERWIQGFVIGFSVGSLFVVGMMLFFLFAGR